MNHGGPRLTRSIVPPTSIVHQNLMIENMSTSLSTSPDTVPDKASTKKRLPDTLPQSRKARLWRRTFILFMTVTPFLVFVIASIYYWDKGISLASFILLGVFYAITTIGIGVGYHRLFTHKGFMTKPWLKATLAVAGSFALQGPVTHWVADHRRHHAYSDRPGDPHSPHVHEDESWWGMFKGFIFAHVGWLFTKDETSVRKFAPDLMNDKLIASLDRYYGLWILLSFLLPAALGYLIVGTWQGGLEGLIWGGAVRIFFLHHVTWSINSICHVFGQRPFDTRDESRNNWVFGIFAFGEGWHNNHHAFPAAAFHGFKWWQIDVNGMVIWLFEKLGWAWNVKRATLTQKDRF